MNANRAEVEQINKKLIGAIITSALTDTDGEFFGFQIQKRNKIINVWVNMDPEGNRPGHLEVEPT